MNRVQLTLPFILLLFPLFSQGIDLDQLNAEEDFRWGVIAYNGRSYNEAIRAFERALSRVPDSPIYMEWLGSALHRSGFVTAAEETWSRVLEVHRDPLLQNRMELGRLRTFSRIDPAQESRYSVSGVLSGITPAGKLFNRPSSIFALADGGFLIASFAGDEVLAFDANGRLMDRYIGGLDRMSGPFDVLMTPQGDLFVSEYNGDRITRIRPGEISPTRFGSRGRGEGELLGPQFLALDASGYLYVTDFGNRRVTKFDQNGEFVLSFGMGADGDFSGLLEPTGIAVVGTRAYVSDARLKGIYVFDLSGNYQGSFLEGRVERPEGLSAGSAGELLVVDDGSIYSVEIAREKITVVSTPTERSERVLKAVRDMNSNIVAVDFNKNKIVFHSESLQLYSGLVVRVDRIVSFGFPTVQVEVTVEDSLGNPMVGLSERNFFLAEPTGGGNIQNKLDVIYKGHLSPIINVALVMDRSMHLDRYSEDLKKVITGLYARMDAGGTMAVVSAGETPGVDADENYSLDGLIRSATGGTGEQTERGKLDIAIRLGAARLLSNNGHRSILYFTGGESRESSFDRYSVLELAQHLKNNGVSFFALSVVPEDKVSDDLKFLCQETSGDLIYLFRPKGISGLFDQITSTPDGTYVIEYKSSTDGELGRRFIPFQAEVILHNRSGRDRSGYYSPVQY